MDTHAQARARTNHVHPWDVTRQCIGPHVAEVARALGLSPHTVAKWRLEPSHETGDELHGIRGPVERLDLMIPAAIRAGRDPLLAAAPARYLYHRHVEVAVQAASSALRLVADLDQTSGTLSALIALAFDDGAVDASEFVMVNEALDRHEQAIRRARATVRAA